MLTSESLDKIAPALAAAQALTATGNAQTYARWGRTTPRMDYDRATYFESLEAIAQRRRLIQLQEEANREARKQRVAIEDSARQARAADFARELDAARARRDAELDEARRSLRENLAR